MPFGMFASRLVEADADDNQREHNALKYAKVGWTQIISHVESEYTYNEGLQRVKADILCV